MTEFTGENQIYEALFRLTNAALSGESIERDEFSDVDFKKLYAVAAKHAVITELEAVAADLPMSEEDAAMWENSILYQLKRFGAIRDEQKRVFSQLEEKKIPFVVLKGFAASMYYPKPFARMHGDVDLLLKEESLEEACAILEADGYARKSDAYGRHEELKKGQFSFELHRRYSDEENDTFGPEIDEILLEKMADRVPETVDGVTFYRFPDALNGLVLLKHLAHHFKSGIGLRQVHDWLMFSEKAMTKELWENELKPLCEKTGLLSFSYVMTELCVRYMGLSEAIPSRTPQTIDESLLDDALSHILTCGNMGLGRTQAEKSTLRILRGGNIFVRLQKAGRRNWKATEEHKILRPFAWAYQAGKYIKKGLFERKAPIQSLKNDLKTHKEEEALFQKLGI